MPRSHSGPAAFRDSSKPSTPWGINHYPNGKRERLYFGTRKERDVRLAELAGARRVFREKAVAGAEVEDVVIARTVKEALQGRELTEMLDVWRRWTSRASCTVEAAANEYLKTKQDDIERGDTHAKVAIDDFRRAYHGDGRQLKEMTLRDIQAYVDGLKREVSARSGMRLSPTTIRNRYKIIVAWLNWCRRRELIGELSFKDIDLPSGDEGEIGIISPEEAYRLFYGSMRDDPGVCSLLALCAFAGVRSETVTKLELRDVKVGRGVDFRAKITKTKKPHYAEGLPDNLWPWYVAGAADAHAMTNRQFQARRDQAYRRAEIRPPHNWARHSFATYYSALHGDVGKAATVLGHWGAQMTWQHYKGRATQFDAKAYFGIHRAEVMPTPATFARYYNAFKAMDERAAEARVIPAEMLKVLDVSVRGADDSWLQEKRAVEDMLLPCVRDDVREAYLNANYAPRSKTIPPNAKAAVRKDVWDAPKLGDADR